MIILCFEKMIIESMMHEVNSNHHLMHKGMIEISIIWDL